MIYYMVYPHPADNTFIALSPNLAALPTLGPMKIWRKVL